MLKNCIKIFIYKFCNSKIINYIYLIRSFFKKYHSSNLLDKKIEKYLNYENGYFVELGANDGIRNSNTLFFERKKKWRGLLIEPLPDKYNFCKMNRIKTTDVVNYACLSKNKKKVKMIDVDLMTTLATNRYINIKKHLNLANNKIFTKPKNFLIEGKTLNYILKKKISPKIIDLMSIDTEGTEIDVLNGINLKKYIVRLILIETRNIKEISKKLKKYNFFLKEKIKDKDYIFLNNKFYDK